MVAFYSAILLLLVAAVGATSKSDPYECLDPPTNGLIAETIAGVLNSSRSLISEGIPSLGIPPMDPLGPLPNIAFHVDTEGVRMNFQLNETTVRNLAQFIICQLNVSLGISQKFDMDLMMDDFHIDGFYNLDGTVAAIFPVFGAGTFRMDAINSGLYGAGKITTKILTKTLALSDFDLDMFFDDLEVELDAILGGGEMADLVNSVISKIAPPMFDAVWSVVRPIMSQAMEDGINEILSHIPIGLEA